MPGFVAYLRALQLSQPSTLSELPQYVQDEVKAALGDEGRFEGGPLVPSYDKPFVVRDGNLITGRWPGDTARLAEELVAAIEEPREG